MSPAVQQAGPQAGQPPGGLPSTGRSDRDRLGIAVDRPRTRLSERLMAICRAGLPGGGRTRPGHAVFAPSDIFDDDDKW